MSPWEKMQDPWVVFYNIFVLHTDWGIFVHTCIWYKIRQEIQVYGLESIKFRNNLLFILVTKTTSIEPVQLIYL